MNETQKSRILIGDDLSADIAAACGGGNVFILFDRRVHGLFGGRFCAEEGRMFLMEPGEDAKSPAVAGEIVAAMLQGGCNRKTTLIAVGGGVAGDLGGFVASVFMRGIDWINVPTTLLSQVDSSVGGKTAVNVGGVKNSMGRFHLPKTVYISAHFLPALPPREWVCGLGEIVKTAYLDAAVYALYKTSFSDLCARDCRAVSAFVRACVAFKEAVTARDFLETTGKRKILNAGHTLGHALEAADGHARSHGEYVLIGLYAEALLFRDDVSSEVVSELKTVVKALVKDGCPPASAGQLGALCAMDKKNEGRVSFMVIAAPGDIRELCLSPAETADRLRALAAADGFFDPIGA